METEKFFDIYLPTDPKQLINQGIVVPFIYLCAWYRTYGCNNWRKRNGLPMLRGKCNKPTYVQTLL